MLARVSSTPTFRRLPRAVREQQMLDAAVKVFSRRGYHAASMDEIADDAGISKPMVYAYLGTKEELFIACLHREGTRMMQAIAGAVAPDLSADERLWRSLRAFLGFVGAHRDGWAVLYRQARGEQPFAGEIAAMRSRMVEIVAGMLAHTLRAECREVAETELEVVAYALVGATESVADWLVDHPEADPEQTATRVMNVAWVGAAQLLAGTSWHPPTSQGEAPPDAPSAG
ncbi:TetR/AcrR family transcriptional regulator [Salinispora arenicola]|uniref:TetR family transcriptional regulator n=1 Tax=Salinispora arenicola TaxID=168697 RepID=A0A542XJN3_SALAC|nr:TetR/AcrR family transcriptional regulator [Salinispora arenicola]TQL36065.1 TetR family transcriptional regulator [Salinispora arenicola]GIM83602.1 TetR family transcriptional regulator [Salinispora arenicola]